MAGKSPIEWTEHTWNPIVGCSILTPGCTNCYAMKMASRIEAMKRSHYDGTTKKVKGNAVWTGQLALAPDNILLEPLRRKKPTTYFVNSMGDLFHDDAPYEWIDKVFAVMSMCPQHTFQVLTKRAERMRAYCLALQQGKRSIIGAAKDLRGSIIGAVVARASLIEDNPVHIRPLPNVWLGVSTERQQEADERIPHLLNTPAAVRFISAEPLLGPINLNRLCLLPQKPGSIRAGIHLNALAGHYCESGVTYTGDWDVTGPAPPAGTPARKLDWVIVGGESGSNARPMHPDWARGIRDQCAAAGVPMFFKQWGAWEPWAKHPLMHDRALYGRGAVDHQWPDRSHSIYVGKKAAGRLLDGIEHNAMPERVRG